MTTAPTAILYSSDGYELATSAGSLVSSNDRLLLVAGSDGSNHRLITLDSSGRSVVVGAGTAGTPAGGVISIQGVASGVAVPISGSVTVSSGSIVVTQPTAANLNATVAQGAPNSLANKWPVQITDGINTMPTGDAIIRALFEKITDGYNTAAVKAASTAAIATDPALVVAISPNNTVGVTQSTSPWVTNISQFGGNNVITGTGASGAGIPRVTVSNDSNILATQSGTWTVQPGNTANTTPWLITINQGGNSATVTASNALKVDGSAVTQPVSGTVTSNQGTSPWVTNVTQFGSNNVVTGTGASGVGIPRVTVSNDSNILATQSGTWAVAQGAPNTLANKWPVQITDGTNTMPTMDVVSRRGFITITDGINTMPTGDIVSRAIFERITDGYNIATVKAASTPAAATDPALVVAISPNNPVFTTAASDITPATQNITVQDTASTTTAGANSQSIITGTPTAGSAATFTVSSLETAQVQVSGTWTGTLQVEVSPDGGTTWYIRRLHQTGTDTINASFTANFSGGANIGAYTNIRVRAIAAMTGTAVVKVTESVNNNSIYVGNALRTTDNAGNYQPAMDVAARKAFIAVTDGTNTAAVKASSVAPAATDPALVVSLSPNNSLFAFGGDSRLRVGQETLLFFDNIDGTTIDVNKWTQSQSGMTQTQTGGNLTLNAGSSLTSGNYSILTSNKQMLILDEFPLYVQFRARLISQTNAVLELGFGNAATTTTPTDGVFFRIDATGNLKGVINFNGTETTTATLGTLTASTFYNFEVTIYEDHASYEVQSSDGATNIDVDLPIPLVNGSPISVGHLPIYARVYNSSATSSAAQIVIASVNVQQMDLNMNKPWAEQVSGAGRSAILDPSTLSQSSNYTNSTIPSIATLSNTAAGYTTLGGLYRFNAPAGAETDYALFGYQVPDGFQLYIWSVTITAFVTGAQSTTNPTLLQWAIAANSSAVSLATGAPNPPIFLPIGMQQAPKTASIGDPFNPGTITFIPKTPVVINGGKFFHVVLRVPVGNATASQVIRGSITVEGYFE